MWNFLYIYIILVSVFFIPTVKEAFWFPKEAVFTLGAVCFMALTRFKIYQRRDFSNKWISAFLIYLILSFGYFFYKPLIFNTLDGKILWNLWNYLPVLNSIIGVFFIWALVEYSNCDIWVKIAKLLCWLGFAFSCYAILQAFGIDQIFNENNSKNIFEVVGTKRIIRYWRMITTFGNSMHTANFIAAISPLCLIFKDFRYKVFYIIMFIAIALSMSAISLGAFILAFLIYFLLLKRYKTFFVLSIILIIFLCLIPSIDKDFWDFSSRLEIWKDIFKKTAFSMPFSGFGWGSFAAKQYIAKSSNTICGAAECEPLQIFHDGGLIVITLLIGYLINLTKRILYAEKSILLLGWVLAGMAYLIICCGSFPLRIAPLALLGILIFSSIEHQI